MDNSLELCSNYICAEKQEKGPTIIGISEYQAAYVCPIPENGELRDTHVSDLVIYCSGSA